MNDTILLIDYEPRTVYRVTEALSPLGHRVQTVKDLDAAVGACATVEPRLVILTSVLPRLKVEDAITQLRARAGLRSTPFLVLMSGYAGSDRRSDAARMGAQSLIAKPFSNEELLEEVKGLLQAARSGAPVGTDTRAEVLDALRRTAGLQSGGGTFTSKDLFGDLLETDTDADQAATRRIKVDAVVQPPPAAADPPPTTQDTTPKSASPVQPPPTPVQFDTGVERTLSKALGAPPAAGARPAPSRPVSDGESVDDLLSKTLSGLDISGLPKPRPRPAPAEVQPPAVEAAAPPAAAPPETPVTPAHQAAAPVEQAPPQAAPPVAPTPVQPAVTPVPAPEPTPPHAAEPQPSPVAETPTPTPARAAMGPLPSGTPFGQYELMELIATGGMAEVYKARMSGVEGFQKIVAIKRILPHLTDNDEFVTMFIDEAKLAAQLQHPNIIHIYDLGKIERSYYIAMEFIDGKDLRSILRTLEEKGRKLPLPLALFVVSRLAAALDYAHRKRDLQGRDMDLVHRDVSPQNVLISFDGEIKLCDFGIAKAAVKASQTRVGALKGKLQYMSPEQAWGKGIDHRSDIFSLGLVLYELITDRKGFAGDSELSILEQARSPRLPRVRDLDPSIPEEVEQVALKALQENPDRRYRTARDLANDLESILHGLKPSPSTADLAGFLAELFERERPVRASTQEPAPEKVVPVRIETPAKEATPAEAPAARKPAASKPPVVLPPPMEPLPIADSQVIPPAKRFPVGLVAGIAMLAVAASVAIFLLTRGDQAPEDPLEAVRRAAEAEVARIEAERRERLPDDGLPAEDGTETTEAPVAVEPPAVVTTAPTPVPTAVVAIVVPTAAPTAVPSPVPVEPEPEPTPVPTAPPPTPQPVATRPPTPTRPPLVAQAPQTREGDLVELTPDVTPPQVLQQVRPEYPPAARRQRVGGTVILEVLVDHTGQVEDVRVLRSVRSDIDNAAVAAVRSWRYRPATKDGVRVKVRQTQPVNFTP